MSLQITVMISNNIGYNLNKTTYSSDLNIYIYLIHMYILNRCNNYIIHYITYSIVLVYLIFFFFKVTTCAVGSTPCERKQNKR